MNSERTPRLKSSSLLPDPQTMILLIDDQAMVGEAVRRLLADQPDLSLHYCPDPLICMEQAIQIMPTVILLDLVMPQIDGLELLRLFRANPTVANIPIVVLSTTEDPEVKGRAFAAGANDYLVKLPSKIELIARIRYHSKSYLNLLQRDDAFRALRESQQQLLDSNTALNTMNQAYLQAKEEAENANKSKSEFLSRMSHELRTPLNAILGFGQLLEMNALSPRQHKNVEQILKGGRHLLDLINEVLDIASIEAGRLALSLEPVPVSETINEVLTLIQPLATKAGIELQKDESLSDERFVLVDRQRLKQILLNLLANAVKYNRRNGSIRVSWQVQDNEAGVEQKTPSENPEFLRLLVADSGFGITAHDAERLFAPFERLQASESTIEGAGLGLALSKRLVEVMGGKIGVDSTVGQGSTFWVDLLLTKGPVEQHKNNGADVSSLPPLTESDVIHNILYIEDNLSNLTLVEHILVDYPGMKLISAMQGSIGFDLACENRPDIILLDLHLPDMSGYEVLCRLKAEPRTRDIPVIIISADATVGQMRRLRTAGAADYLSKPIDVRSFLQAMDKNLNDD